MTRDLYASLLLILFLGIVNAESYKILNRVREKLPVVFWDLDHTLYPQSSGVYSPSLVLAYMRQVLGLSESQSKRLLKDYDIAYTGQVLAGLVKDFKVDPVEFEAWIDQRADLTTALQPDPSIIKTLSIIKARNWIITNSGWEHAWRIITRLGIEQFIEGVIFLDYDSQGPVILKPSPAAFERAMMYAGVTNADDCYFIDDIQKNSEAACKFGFKVLHYCEPGFCTFERLHRRWEKGACELIPQIRSIEETLRVFPELLAT